MHIVFLILIIGSNFRAFKAEWNPLIVYEGGETIGFSTKIELARSVLCSTGQSQQQCTILRRNCDKEITTSLCLSSNIPKNITSMSPTNSSHYIISTIHNTTDPEFLQFILPVIEQIVSLPEDKLHPSPITNSLFTSLVNLICVDDLKGDTISTILSHHDIIGYQQQLMQKCSSAEYFLEVDFARQVQSGAKSIEDFLYYENYVSLVQFEMESLKIYAGNVSINRAVVIGSGPLPLTSVEVLKHLPPSAVIINYDHSAEAVELGTIVINKISRLSVEHRSALQITAKDLEEVDLVYLAALVGIDKAEKMEIMKHLYDVMRPGSILIARSAIGLKTLVYRRLTIEEFGEFSNIQEFHPKDKKVLNSIACGTR
ncbi:nicotianamine synthase 1-like [Bradysia coprophila]|uniref:nicotianamine synthase 1-like n=1 Tax=Bradysia coprophila TaxID=38358 RepID=UPI00187D72FD|nr:nicotianamine synthase 1-like [Bradysia coprophila]XP_037030973.1 nicotianamine synthase 1-like [Bradysia coprophila]XP_037030974.1 nicotianamine synthase 1-like [Bradysia coprophila]